MLLNILLSLIIVPSLYQNNFVFENALNLNKPEVSMSLETDAPERVYTEFLDVEITAKNILAVDAKTGKILYEKNSREIVPIASITKLMTALVFLDYNPGWQKEFYTISSDRRNGGIIHLNAGEILKIRDLFYTALIPSDNDAAMALARATNLSEENFVKKMNAKARSLGLNNTQFFDPTGLNRNNVSNTEEIIKLLNFALANEDIQKATSTAYYEFEVNGENYKRLVKLRNTDLLLNSYLNIIGGKTGHLESAGYCLAVKLKGENEQEIFVVVLDSDTNFDRFQDVKAISDWIFSNYQW